MRGLDIAFPVSPEQFVADMRAAGAQVASPYVLNWSDLRAVQPPDYFTALRAAGFHVSPIVVPGNTPGPQQAVLDALSAAGCQGGPVELDIEPGSYPPQSWVMDWYVSMRNHGFSPGQYAGAADRFRYGDIFDWHRLADWTYVEHDPPAGYVAVQWSDKEVINGSTYDISTWSDTFQFPTSTVPPVTEEDMPFGFIVFSEEPAQWVITPNGTRFAITSQDNLATFLDSALYVRGGKLTDDQLAQIPIIPKTSP